MEERVEFSAHKTELKKWPTRAEQLRRSQAMLSRALNLHTTVAFLGAGCSVPLGYPTWQQFALDTVSYSIERCKSGRPEYLEAPLVRLEHFQERLRAGPVETNQLIYILGECKRVFEGCNCRKDYYRFLRRTFKPRPRPDDAPNPYQALLGLPIRRFITSNYDREIEIALTATRNVPKKQFRLHTKKASPDQGKDFTQEQEYRDQLAMFAMARVHEADNAVFHCHGHYNRPESMVVTEDDYQNWYLTEETRGGLAFHQTIQLLFGSNPILFLGFGLQDDDLLRSLRTFIAVDPERKSSRPLFALMPEQYEGEKEDENQFFYERYGVNVIPFPAPKLEERGQALCDALINLQKEWNRWWAGWLAKPNFRAVQVGVTPPTPYYHYRMTSEGGPKFGGQRVRDLLQEMHDAAEAETRLIGIVGLGGTGKSWYAQQLIESLQDRKSGFEGFFFWSSYYANDSLTGIERALAYLDPGRSITGSRIDRFIQCLSRGRYLLVFDGIERFLRETANPDIGRTLDPVSREFLQAMADPRSRSTVLLTSRLWPEELGASEPTEQGIRQFRLGRFTTADIESIEPFSWVTDRQDLSALCSLLDGHIYGIVLAARIIKIGGRRGAQTQLRTIIQALAATPPDRRPFRIIREAISGVDEQWHGLSLRLLDRVSVFMSPLPRKTIETCYEGALGRSDQPSPERLDLLIDSLLERRLLHSARDRTNSVVYTVHPIVREYIYQQSHRYAADAIPNFTLPGFTAGTARVDPGSLGESIKVVTDIFDRLHKAGESAADKENLKDARAYCRAAFGVVRSRMEAITAPRWCHYNDYMGVLVKLANLTKRISPRVWEYAERREIRSVEDDKGPLYADELAWLYNEIGLASFGEGSMPDALGVWEQGYEINKVIDSFEEGGRYIFQSLCNLGAAYIHFGQLAIAERFLRDAERVNFRLNDEDHKGRIKGYLAVVQHLRGNIQRADEMYKDAIELIKKSENLRAESIFMKHWADLKIKLGDREGARLFIATSRSLGEAGHFPELIAYARLSLGHLFRSQKDFPSAQREYNAVLAVAKRIGAGRIQAEAISELSRLAFDLGDAQLARQRAIESLRLANELVLGLRQTHGLVVLGLATIETGSRELGLAYLRHAKTLANQQQYWLRAYEAEEHLQKYGEPSEPHTRLVADTL